MDPITTGQQKNRAKQPNKPTDNGLLTTFGDCLLRELNLADVERTNARDFVPRMYNCRRATLRPHEDNVDEFRRRRHRLHLLEVVDRHGVGFLRIS